MADQKMNVIRDGPRTEKHPTGSGNDSANVGVKLIPYGLGEPWFSIFRREDEMNQK